MYSAFLTRSDDRWPRWVTRIGLPALRRALLRDDEAEFPIQVLTILPSLPVLLARWLAGESYPARVVVTAVAIAAVR